MSDSEIGTFATTGSGKSEAEVAFDLLNKLKGQGVWGERNVGAILDMYAECLDATKGLRPYAGQKRIDAPVQKASAAPARQAAQVPAPTQQVTAQQQALANQQALAQQQLAAQQAQMQQPVHAQQAAVQQAYKQG